MAWLQTHGLTQADINERVLSTEHLTANIGARAIKGGVIAVGAQFLRFGVQIMGTAALSRLLVPEHFGLVAMATAVMALVSALTELNISVASIQREKLDQDTASALLIFGIGISVATVALAAATAPLGAQFFHQPVLVLIVIGLAAATPIYALGSQHYALLTRNMRWMDLQIASIIPLILSTFTAIIAAWLFNAGYWALVIQAWVNAAASSVLGWILCPWRPSIVRDWTGAKASLGFGLNLTASGILNYFHRQCDNVLIGWRWGSTELGFYARAYTLLMTPINFLNGPLGYTMIPVMSRLRGEPEKWRNAYIDTLSVITFVSGALACLLYGGAHPIVEILLGQNWDHTATIFKYLTLGMLAATPLSTVNWIYITLDRTDRLLIWESIGVPIILISFLIGLPFGAVGVALSYSISRYVSFLPGMWMATRKTNISVSNILAAIALPSMAAIAIGLGLETATKHLNLVGDVVAIGLGGILYATIIGLAVWNMPIYARLRARALIAIAQLRVRFQPA